MEQFPQQRINAVARRIVLHGRLHLHLEVEQLLRGRRHDLRIGGPQQFPQLGQRLGQGVVDRFELCPEQRLILLEVVWPSPIALADVLHDVADYMSNASCGRVVKLVELPRGRVDDNDEFTPASVA